MRDLEGKLVLVTGSGKGVGRVLARRFAERGADVIINFFHSLEAAKQTRAELEAMGARVEMMRASVAQCRQVERMFREIEERFGYLDILVNNAASGALVPTDQVSEEHLDRALGTNLKGSFWCARLAAPLIARRGGGCIVNLSSIGAGMVPANYLAVGTSKAAVESLTRYLAVEYAPLNIRVNTASATMLEGEVAQQFPRYEEMRQVSVSCTPLGRLGTAEDLAGVVMFLTSDQSRWVTGQTILADGGLSLGSALLSPPPLHRSLPSPPGPSGDTTGSGCEPCNGHDDGVETIASLTPLPAARPTSRQAVPQDADLHTGAPDEGADGDAIAIVGMGLAVPGANSPDEYWRVLMAGPDLFTTVPPDRWDYHTFYSPNPSEQDKTYQNKSVFITDGPDSPGSTGQHEMTTAWLRHSLLQALQGVTMRAGDRFSFVVGYTADGSQHLEESLVLAGARHHFERALEDMGVSVADREAMLRDVRRTLEERYRRGASSPSVFLPHKVGRDAMDGVLPEDTELQMVDTACSSSLYAVDIGIKGLLMGKHDIAICGGAFALAPRGSVLFAKLHGLSTRGEVRALDKDSDGVLFADGAGVVVLKKLSRARADGDRILAVVKSFGSSSDGKGKAIYAPSSAGQSIAIRRAFDRPDVDLHQVDWVVAHATGTPAGDLAEFSTLREMIRSDHPVYVTSNKSVIGHTGWTAGVASLIEVILGLQQRIIPPQHRFSAPPHEFDCESSNLEIPLSPVPWQPREGRLRAASISGFGFGGTNAHLIIQEHGAAAVAGPALQRAHGERIAIVARAAHLPGLGGPEDAMAWPAGETHQPDASFGDFYPLPSFEKVRMPPATVRTLDRCQLMVLECAHELRRQLGAFWTENREMTGVIMGHMGPTRTATLYAARCYLDDIEQALRADDQLAASPLLQPLLERFRKRIEYLVPPANENSFPGMMPNVIPARVANFFDLKGLNMTVDTGFSSTLSAVEVAARYLRNSELDMALVGGINGNTTPEMGQILDDLAGKGEMLPAEGAFLFALVRETTARDAGLPILGYVDSLATGAPTPPDGRMVGCGLSDAGTGRYNYLGAEGARAIWQAVLTLHQPTHVVCRSEDGVPDAVLTLEPPTQEEPPAMRLPPQYLSTEEYAPGTPLQVKRQVARLEEVPRQPVRPAVDFFAPGTLVLTDQPDLLAGAALPPGVAVLSTTPLSTASPNHFVLPNPTPETVDRSLAGITFPVRHIRLLTDLTRAAPLADCLWQEPASLLRLHDLAFLVLKRCYASLEAGESSVVSLCLDAVPGGAPHPFTGLLTGLIKCLALEIPACLSYTVMTSTKDVGDAVRQAEAESRAQQLLPLVVYDEGVRKTVLLEETAGALPPDAPPAITPDSVVVATAGARGITAEILKRVAQHFRPHLYMIGSNRLDSYPAACFAGDDEEFSRTRPVYLREQRLLHPDKSVAVLNKEFDRILDARTTCHNIAAMEAYCGPGKVHYVACDVLDRAAVTRTIEDILAAEGRIDLLINAAGLNRSASIPAKSFDDFRRVRDIKISGYQNLKYALRHSPPRLWCNFGSFIGLTGQLGETDYASANDFLATAAGYVTHAAGGDEFTIGWTLWGEVGLGANPVTKAFLDKSRLFTSMGTAEGIHHFIREINLPRHDPSTVHLGVAEKQAITDYLPDFFQIRKPVTPVTNHRFYLGRVHSQSDDEVVFERVFDLERDGYLKHHLVNGYATLPGTFVPEIAAEAASYLLPDLHVVALEDVAFHHFLRIYETGKPAAKRIQARVVERTADQAVVRVKVLTDVIGPKGTVLVKDKLHFELSVILRSSFPPAPSWEPWDEYGEESVPDPYHVPAAPVLLSDMFVSTTNTRSHPLGKRAVYDLHVAADDPTFSSFILPSILLDGLARVAVLTRVEGEYIPLAAPATIRRIDVYEAGNDCLLARTYQAIELYACPGGLSLEQLGSGNRFVAMRPDGKIILQMKDVTGTIVGYVHHTTGQFVSRTQLEELRCPQKPVPTAFMTDEGGTQ